MDDVERFTMFLSTTYPRGCFRFFVNGDIKKNEIFCVKDVNASSKYSIYRGNWDDFLKYARNLVQGYPDQNIYVSHCSFEEKNGVIDITAEYVSECGIIDIDIDHFDRLDMVNYNLRFRDRIFSPFLVMWSGHGYHLFYRLTYPVPAKVYKDIAYKFFMKVFAPNNMQILRYVDRSSFTPGHLTRLPGSWNAKAELIQTKLLDIDYGGEFDVDVEAIRS